MSFRGAPRSQGDIKALVGALKAAGAGSTASNLAIAVDGKLPADFARRGDFSWKILQKSSESSI
jgi:hypothetical protein